MWLAFHGNLLSEALRRPQSNRILLCLARTSANEHATEFSSSLDSQANYWEEGGIGYTRLPKGIDSHWRVVNILNSNKDPGINQSFAKVLQRGLLTGALSAEIFSKEKSKKHAVTGSCVSGWMAPMCGRTQDRWISAKKAHIASFSRGKVQKKSMHSSKDRIQEENQKGYIHEDNEGAPSDMDSDLDDMDSDLDDMDSDSETVHSDLDSAPHDSDSEGDATEIISPQEVLKGIQMDAFRKLPEREKRKLGREMAEKLVAAALDEPDEEEDGLVPKHKQQSLRVGILGAANAGKSSLLNFMVGIKVAAVSRKRNTTLSEILGIMTKGSTQILFYDTPGLVLDILGSPSKTDTRRRSESAWQLFAHCEVLLVIVDAYRQIHKPDKRILRLVKKLGSEENPHPKRILCLNKVDIVDNKKDLLPLAQLFGNLPGYESIFMISALTGSGVKDVENYLMNEAVLRPWEEEPNPLNEETTKTLSMEIVREHLLHRVHEEIPYELDHQLTDWQELEDGSLRIEQHFYLPKKGQCRIVVGKGGSKIREIGIKACEELRQLLGRKVHLYLEVKHGGGF